MQRKGAFVKSCPLFLDFDDRNAYLTEKSSRHLTLLATAQERMVVCMTVVLEVALIQSLTTTSGATPSRKGRAGGVL